MVSKSPKKISSGVEPVDRVLGGLDGGGLYLVEGEESSGSLFGIKFLVEGLKHGENCALVIDYSPEGAVRRFARLGYDCLEDIYSGRLAILECSDNIVGQIAGLAELAPVLGELKHLMGESSPQRIVFEPIGRLLGGHGQDNQKRAGEFAAWATDIGATTLLIACGDNQEVIRWFRPLVKDCFRFDLRKHNGRDSRWITFGNSPGAPEQEIEVDPSRGIFLFDRAQNRVQSGPRPTGPEAPPGTAPPETETPLLWSYSDTRPPALPERQAPGDTVQPAPELDMLSDWLSELVTEASGLPPPVDTSESEAGPIETDRGRHTFAGGLHRGASEQKLTREPEAEGRFASPTVEELLRPPADIQAPGKPTHPAGHTAATMPPARAPVSSDADDTKIRAEDFKVLIISGDEPSCKLIARALADYGIERAGDGISGLAKLISLRPDLVVLDVDLPVVDGFKVLAHIRANLNMPIVVVSSSHMRASDRIQSAELGADYYLTKPFSLKELRHKARQLIARYRGIEEWIATSLDLESAGFAGGPGQPYGRGFGEAPVGPGPGSPHRVDSSREQGSPAASGSQVLPYKNFVMRVDEKVKEAIDGDSWFSIVGCRLQAGSEDMRKQLFELVSLLVRDGDVLAFNHTNDLMLLLPDADAAGAKAFIARLRDRILEGTEQEPTIWLRSFPLLDQTSVVASRRSSGGKQAQPR